MPVVSLFLRYSNINFAPRRFFSSFRKIPISVKIFSLSGVANSFSSFPCFYVSGVVESIWKATLMAFSVGCCILSKVCQCYNFHIYIYIYIYIYVFSIFKFCNFYVGFVLLIFALIAIKRSNRTGRYSNRQIDTKWVNQEK